MPFDEFAEMISKEIGERRLQSLIAEKAETAVSEKFAPATEKKNQEVRH